MCSFFNLKYINLFFSCTDWDLNPVSFVLGNILVSKIQQELRKAILNEWKVRRKTGTVC